MLFIYVVSGYSLTAQALPMADDQCIPFYEQHEYFIFDREDLHRISETSAGERESVISLQGMTVEIFMSDPSTLVVNQMVYTHLQLGV